MASMFFVFVAALSIFHLLVGAFVVPLPSDSAAGPSEFLFRPSKETGKGSSTVLHAGYSRGRKRLQNEYREAAGGEDGFNALLESIKTVKVQGGGAASSMSGGDVYSKRREERAWGVKSAKRIGKAAGRGSSGKVRNHSIFTNAKDPFALDDPVLDAERGDGFGGNYGDGGLYGDGRKSRGSRESDSAFFDNPDDAWRQDREKRGGRDDGREGWGERETGGRFSRTGDRESRGANKRSERDRRDGASFGRDRERERRQWDERESFDREEESGPLFPSSSRQRKPIPSLRSPRDRSGRGDADFEEKGRDRMGSPQRQRERSFSGDFDWLEGDGGDRKSSRRGEGGVSYWKGERAGYDDFVPAQLNTMLSHAASHEELMTLLDRHMEKFDYKNYFTALQRLGKVGGKKLNGRESSSNVTVSRLLEKVEAAVDSKPILAPFHAASACWALGKLRIFRASLLLKISEKMSGPTAKDQMKATDVAQIAHGIARMSEAAGGEQWASFLSTGGASSLETLFATLQERFLQTLKQQGSAAPPSQKDLSLFLWSLAKLGGGIAKNQQEMMEAAAQVWSSGIPLGKEKEGKSIDVDMSTVMWAFAKSGALTEGRASPALLSCVRQIANQAQEVWGQGKLPLRALSNLLWSFAQAPEGTLSMEFWGSARGALLDILESSDPSDIQPLSLATCFLAIPNPNTHTATQSPKSKQPQSEKGDEENEEAAARERQSQKAARVRISILHEEVVQKGLEVAIEILTGRKPEREGEYGEGMEENSRGRGMRQRHKKITARPLHRLEPSLIAEMLRAFASAAGGDAASSGSRPTVPFLKQFFRAGADEAARLLPAMTTAQMVSCCHSVARALGTEGGEGVFVSFWSAVLREIQKRGADSLGADDLAIFVWALSDAQPQAALSQFGGPGRSPLVPIGDAVRGAERERKDPWKKETGSPEELDEETDAEEEMDFLSTLCRHATVRASSRELSPKHTAMLIRAFAVLRKSRGNTASLVSRALTASIERLEEFDPHALASLLWALAKFPFARSLWYSKIFPFFKGVAGLIVSRYEAAKGGDKPARKWLRSFSPQATANVIWAFGANLVTGSDVVVKLLTKELVIPQLDRFSYQVRNATRVLAWWQVGFSEVILNCGRE
uniref:MI domain-containing protein n=1 Tax=Chromera velia CCMP2878 TaxID=1169474 RepID=A0A0G4HR25_9ALVE|eukprot:Cvel_8069.t1-p1 / transcript=Cvel_8069.t1 / gene=Cvel_8069 / organism=Chromera_velia_CCMP2878 / gene_product=hypothetical protein / transcript_product=hypothetical protein / location=Cvel_scaffold437:68460-74299(+) / protein_length=1134 / sequence_SO=supercontig / SO=protein_coding / is_pseudo=false